MGIMGGILALSSDKLLEFPIRLFSDLQKGGNFNYLVVHIHNFFFYPESCKIG
jgi:hypothetical protein